LRHDLLAIVQAGLAACDAGRLLGRALEAADAVPPGPVRVIAAGKAARAMAAGAARVFGRRIQRALLIAPSAADSPEPFEAVASGHPVPTAESERAGRLALALADAVEPGETLVVLISGGASALMAVPADGLTLDDKRRTTDRLLRAGADIHALNTVRKHLSAIKGGQLAARVRGACRTFAISDVVGDDLSVIASGPTVADASTFADACAVIERFGGDAAFPAAVVERLRQGAAGAIPETPKPGDGRLARATAHVIGSRRDAMAGAAREAAARGYAVLTIDEPVVGEAREAAARHLEAVLQLARSLARPLCAVSTGETTVHVTGSGRGGRNQEFALAAALALPSGAPTLAIASAGTDGVDGPTDAAGAIVDSTTLNRAGAGGLSPRRHLDDNDTYPFFRTLDDLILTGPTGTNVGDLQLILIA
jgi:hydroxypyruvate reductase